jgi:uncharacterized protein YdeI (BOF family)
VSRLLILLSATVLLAGCSGRATKVLGVLGQSDAISVGTVASTPPDAAIVVRGTMTEKCPVAGCWFMLRDATGTIKVDTKSAGFAVVDIPLRTELIVAGRITTNGAQRIIEASGIRY